MRRSAVRASALLALCLASLSAKPSALARRTARGQPEAAAPATGWPEAGGTHWRLQTAHGPVHAWLPGRYEPLTAGFVFYVHGFYTDVDRAWREHNLATQFAQSRKNALFVACEAPRGGIEPPAWDSAAALSAVVTRALAERGLTPPQVPHVVVVGHSGAWRTLVPWLDETLAHVVLVDALYSNEIDFANWIDGAETTPDGAFTRQLTVVAEDTVPWTGPFADLFSDIITRPRLPWPREGWTAAEKSARIVYCLSQYRHMELVSGGKALPVLLGRTGLTELGPRDRPRRRAR